MEIIGSNAAEACCSAETLLNLAERVVNIGLEAGRFTCPPRSFFPAGPNGERFGLMPIIFSSPNLLGLKVINIFPGNARLGRETHVGLYQLYSGDTGELLALIDARTLTGIRTAAMSAFATKHLARDPAGHLSIVGTGHQAYWHAKILGGIFKPHIVTIAGRNADAAKALMGRLQNELPDLDFQTNTIEKAVRQATVFCTTTASADPVVKKEWVLPGQHVNAIGAFEAEHFEFEPELFAGARCFTDDLEGFHIHCGEVQRLAALGRNGPKSIMDLASAQKVASQNDELTIYKSFGSALQDIVFGAYLGRIKI